MPDIAGSGRLSMPDLAFGNDDFGPEPDSLGICRPAAAGNDKSGAVEAGLRPQPEAHGRMPAQLAALELGQALPPLRIGRFAQAALDNPAVPGDHPTAQRQADYACEYERSDKQDNGESNLSRHPPFPALPAACLTAPASPEPPGARTGSTARRLAPQDRRRPLTGVPLQATGRRLRC